jgi:biopolymer transport protein ExbB
MLDYIVDTGVRAGVIVLFIFLASLYAWFLIMRKRDFLESEYRGGDSFWEDIRLSLEGGSTGNITYALKKDGRYISSIFQYVMDGSSLRDMEARAEEKRIYFYRVLNRDMGTIAAIAGISPLLGLLGTVTGMMKTFGAIKLYGSANPALMAEGISQALLTTQAGLLVAFPIIIARAYLKNRIKETMDTMEQILLKLKGLLCSG